MSKTFDRVNAERARLAEDGAREKNWKRWGPYLAERQWGTVREDYSADGSCWDHFPHDHARSRAYRWGEDGLLGITDRQCRLCFALALWNERDPVLKERLFGLTNPEGNHGEDVKECYFYLDSTPTHSYMRALYKYPQSEFPYAQLVEENRRRGKGKREFELEDTGVFDRDAYFDIFAEYANRTPNDILIRLTIANRGDEEASLHLLPVLWFRNTWDWGQEGRSYWSKPRITKEDARTLIAEHATLGRFRFCLEPAKEETPLLFTENETNVERLYGAENRTPYVKDAFHEYVVRGRKEKVNTETGTKAAAHYQLRVGAKSETTLRFRLFAEDESPAQFFGAEFDETFAARKSEADEFYDDLAAPVMSDMTHATDELNATRAVEAERRVVRQAYAGLLYSKQFYHYVVRDWAKGDPAQPAPPAGHANRNADWAHLETRDIVSMPDKWEYPWFAAWDLAFHTLPLAEVDPEFAKNQLILLLREWYMHPNGQLPAYEFNFSDANPPVHAWAAWRVYKIAERASGVRDRLFLERVFQKLLLNFTWWVNRKDVEGNHIFAGGFLGLDNIGVFDRSQALPSGASLDQADGTAWMAFYCGTMLTIALELARGDEAYEDVASKFFEHFIHITDAINSLGGSGLWDEKDGFYYDRMVAEGRETRLRVRSLVGLVPLLAVEILEADMIDGLPGFTKRMRWLLENRADLARYTSYMEAGSEGAHGEPENQRRHSHRLLAIPSRERLQRVLGYVLDENEFLSPYGIRSLSRVHREQPFTLKAFDVTERRVEYTPGESDTGLFGGNSNWRGPVWFPVNYLLVEALERYGHFYGDGFRVECPTGSGKLMNLTEVAQEIESRLARIFLPDENNRCAWQGEDHRYAADPHWCDLTLFHEYFHGDTGRGLGASHQTGWTALVARLIEDRWRERTKEQSREGAAAPTKRAEQE
ncbi:MAG: glucosidase [Pyrinomonadaceae bacterium]|nr:glucosidase [Pyrinomonadaceae bacterium]